MSANEEWRGDWNYPTPIRFGPGRIVELPEVCKEIGLNAPLLVTDRGLRGSAPFERVVAVLRSAGIEAPSWPHVEPDPTEATVAAGVDACRRHGCDGIVAVGGGSALDAAKAIALMVGQEHPLWDFEDAGDNWRRARAEAILPVVAVPTTAGTGSEVGRCAVVRDSTAQRKVIVFHPRLLPVRVVADPELTATMPPKLTAGTGMDALTHCVEAYFAPGFHPLADGIAAEGTRLVFAYLERAYRNGDDIGARAAMLAAAIAGATAFQKGLGAAHALAHPLGAHTGVHHGTLNGVLLPYVLAWNRAAIEPRAARLAAAAGVEPPAFDGLLDAVVALRKAVGLPATLAELGISPAIGRTVAAEAPRDPSASTNPRPFDQAGARAILDAAFSGRLPRG